MKRYLILIAILMVVVANAAIKTRAPSFSAEISQQVPPAEKQLKKDSVTGFEWTEVKQGNFVGVEINSKIIVPCRYSWVSYENGYFTANIYRGNLTKAACYTTTGKCVIQENRGYNYIGTWSVKDYNYIIVSKNKKDGACDPDGKELISPNMGYDNFYHKGEDKSLYRVEKNQLYGVYDVELKREVVAPQYSELYIFNSDGCQYIKVEKNKREGICLPNGKEIIPPIYKSVFYSSSGQFRYEDADGKYHDTGLDIRGNKIGSNINVASSSSTSSSNTTAASTIKSSTPSSSYSSSLTTNSNSSSPLGRLLFDGTFTGTGKGIAGNQMTVVGEPFLTSFRVYEKRIYYNNGNNTLDYWGEETLFNIRWRKYYNGGDFAYYVSSDGTILQAMIMTFDTLMGKMSSTSYTIYEYGDTRQKHRGSANSGNGYTPQNSNTGSYSGTSSNSKTCSYCHGSGICPNCNGTGWVTNPFGFEHSTAPYPCVSCNKNGDKVHNPNKGKCSLCKGKR